MPTKSMDEMRASLARRSIESGEVIDGSTMSSISTVKIQVSDISSLDMSPIDSSEKHLSTEENKKQTK